MMTNFNQESISTTPSQENLSPAVPSEREKKIHSFKEKMKKFRILKFLIFLILIILLLSLFLKDFLFFTGLRGKKDAWQSVFLTNGQVYFGRIIKEDKNLVILRKVFYLQVTQEEESQSSQPKLSVIKLGQEPHGPEDEMRINRDHILFVEDLKPDSNVVKTIEEYEKK